MQRLFCFLVIALLGSLSSFAGHIQSEQAKQLAIDFLSQRTANSRGEHPQTTVPSTVASFDGYYIVNRGSDQGFVIVAADDRAYTILGYSDKGSINLATAPEALTDWLQTFSNEIQHIGNKTSVYPLSDKKYQGVSPLLGETAWNQGYPYNQLTPHYVGTTNAATGCAATAMAQIMYYHRYPAQGRGQNSFHTSQYNMSLSIDFSQSIYQWQSMKPVYGEWDSQDSREAVAVLMRDCGYAINMDYGAVSGAAPDAWPKALIEYFDYDRGLSNRYRANYTHEEWNEIIRRELDAGRPVFAGGFANSGGHAFVFDGYDEDGLIHVNWGWGGVSNGYFRTSALTPAIQGTGGADGGFNARQSIITGIQPACEGSELTPEFYSSETVKATPATTSKTTSVALKLTGKITNGGFCDAIVDFGFGVYDENNELVLIIPANENDKSVEMTKFCIGINVSQADLSSLSSGDYVLRPIVVEHGGSRWTPVHHGNNARPNYLKLQVRDDGQLTFEQPTKSVLSATNITADTRIYSGVKCSVSAVLRNDGDMDYSSDVRVALYRPSDGMKMAESDNYLEDVLAQDEAQATIISAYNVAPGTYQLNLIDEDSQPLGEPIEVEVLDAPAGEGTAEAVGSLTVTDGVTPSRSELSFTAHLHATSGVFANNVTIYIYDEYETTTSPLGSLEPQFVFIEPDGTLDITFTGKMENGMMGTTYKATLINLDENTYIKPRANASCVFTLSGTAAGIVSREVNPQPQVIYNLQGRRVSQPQKGIYVSNGHKIAIK